MARIVQISVSDGGVPKLPIAEADVGERGLVGDRQDDLKHHGSPDQALCLYSLEVIEALQAEGHPIHPGQAGENVTIIGLDWANLLEGTRLRIGEVLAELTFPAVPCAKNKPWFKMGNFRRMSNDIHPGSSRWYARVIEPGRIVTDDPVVIEPA